VSEAPAAGGPTYNQTYERVGSVYNANQIIINGAPADGEDAVIPERAILAATMLDRGPQASLMLDRLAAAEPHDGQGVVAILQGCNADLHQAFVMRCARIDFAANLAGGPWRYLQRLAWPEQGGSVASILRGVRDRLGLPKTLTQPQTEEEVAKIAANLCFAHFIDEAAWKADGGALVRAWVDYLSSNTLRPAPGFRLVAFLCVEENDPETKGGGFLGKLFGRRGGEAMSGWLEGLRERPAHPHLIPLPPLDVIRPLHVGDWVAEAAAYLRDDDIEQQLFTLSGRVFGDVEDRRFDYVFQVLQKELARALRPRSAFVEINR